MAGLLGDGSDDPGSMANWNLVAGLLSPGSFGQGLGKGLAGYQGSLAASQDYQSKAQALEMQKLQFAAALRNQNLINQAIQQGLGDGGQNQPPAQPQAAPSAPSAPTQPSVMTGAGPTPPFLASPNNPAMGGTAPPAAPQVAPQVPPSAPRTMFGVPVTQAVNSLAFNGGKDLADLAAKYNTPVSFRPGGYAASPNGTMQQFPQVPEGYTANRGADGQWHIVPVDGGTAALASSSTAKAAGPAGLKQVTVIGPDNKPYTVFASALPGFASASGQSPQTPPSNQPSMQIPPAVQATRDADALRIAQNELLRTPAGPDRDQLVQTIARIQAGGSPVPNLGGKPVNLAPPGLPPGAVPTGLAPGTVTTADESAKDAVGNYNTLHTFATSSAPRNIGLLQSIQQLADKTLVGPGSDKAQFVNGVLNTLGITPGADQAQNYQIMTKNLNMLVGSQRMGAAGGGSDALQSLLQASNPNNKEMNGPALKEAADELIAYNRMVMAKDKAMPNPLSTSTQSYQDAETNFAKFSDPRLWQVEHAQNDQERARILSLIPADQRGPFLELARQARKSGVLN